MRILGFSVKWPKLKRSELTTFRFARRDQDWLAGEQVQIVYKPRSSVREAICFAEITGIKSRWVVNAKDDDVKYLAGYFMIPVVTEEEAREDGFKNRAAMVEWVGRVHHLRNCLEPMNKLTLRRIDD